MLEADIWNEIDAMRDEEDPALRGARCSDLAQRLRGVRPASAESLYALGYVLYHHPSRVRDAELQQETDDVLRRAVELEPGDAWSHMYRGYNAYDVGRYREARAFFEAADAAQLTTNFALNREEMMLCIDMRTKGIAKCMPSLDAYVSSAERYEEPDVFPMTLARTLEELHAELLRLPRRDRTHAKWLASRLDKAGGSNDWFTALVP